MGDVRVGLIGFGVAGAVFHAPLIASTPGLRLAAVVTRDPERSDRARRRYDAVVVDRPDRLWSEDLADLVVVAAPNRAHVPLAAAALGAGHPVVVDKPLAVDAAGARGLLDVAHRRGVLLTVFQNRRLDGDFRTVRRLLDDGALGHPLRFESRFERWRPQPKPGWRERGAAEEGGGVLLDLGSHLVDQALVLFGPAQTVYAEVDRRRPGVAVDDDAFVALTHRSGVRSHLAMSHVAALPGPRFRVSGSAAGYTKEGLDPQEDALRSGASPLDVDFGVEPAERWGRLGQPGAEVVVPSERGNYRAFYLDVAVALSDGAPPPVDPADAVAVLDVLDAARQSAATGRTVSLPA